MTKEEKEERREYLMQIVRRLPEKPGSYQYYDEKGEIIYVGKAKNLKISKGMSNLVISSGSCLQFQKC